MRLAPLFIDRESLGSQLTRNFLGDRTFDNLANNFLPGNNNSSGGFFGFLVNAAKQFGGFLIGGIIGFIEWSIGGVIRYLIEKTIELTSFDWAQSDLDLGKSIEQNNGVILNQLGRFIASGAVWLTSIVVAKGVSVKFPVIAGRVALDLATEAGQTLRGQLQGALNVTGELLLENLSMGIYAGSRWLLRKAFPNNPAFSGNGGKKPWTFGEAISSKIEKLPGGNYVRQFATGLLDGAVDSLLDVAYTISFSLDDHYASMREAQNAEESPTRVIEVFPDEEAEESIIISEPQDNIEGTIVNYLSNHELVANRDIATVVGQPYDEWYGLRPQSRRLIIEFNAKETPPFVQTNGQASRRVQISIPNVQPVISWTDLKNIKRFTWGNYLARGVFEDRRQMSVWGASANEAKNQLTELAKLCTTPLIQVTVSTPEVQNVNRRKEPTIVYPVFATALVRRTITSVGESTLIDGQNRAMARQRIPIWKEEAPSGFTGF